MGGNYRAMAGMAQILQNRHQSKSINANPKKHPPKNIQNVINPL
jgi:hypothetical protein